MCIQMNKFTCKVYNFLKHEQFLFLLRNPVRPHWLCIIPTTIVLTDAWCILIASHNRGATFCSHTIHTRTKPQIVCLVCKLLPATKNCNWQRQLVHFAISNDDDQLLLEDLKWISCATCTVLFFRIALFLTPPVTSSSNASSADTTAVTQKKMKEKCDTKLIQFIP